MVEERTQTVKNHITAAVFSAGEELRRFADCRDTIEIGLVLDGSITLQLAGKGQELSAGDIYTVTPGTVYGLVDFSEDARLLRLTFSMDMICCHPEHFFYRDFWEPLFQGAMKLPACISADHPAAPALRAQLTDILQSTDRMQCFVSLMEVCLLLLPHCIYEPNDPPELGVSNRIVRLCMIYILNSYHKRFSLKRTARYVKCHPNYLCAVFKKHTAMTVTQYLYHIRVETAAELLCKEDLPVGKVLELTGFPNRNMFNKKFRQIMGVSPTVYRKERSNHGHEASAETPGA